MVVPAVSLMTHEVSNGHQSVVNTTAIRHSSDPQFVTMVGEGVGARVGVDVGLATGEEVVQLPKDATSIVQMKWNIRTSSVRINQ